VIRKGIFLILFVYPLHSFAGDYNRKEWPHWVDADRDCQNTRHEILIRDSKSKVKYSSKDKCKVKRAKWFGVYTGYTFESPRSLDIDHIVPLKNAHSNGGRHWSRTRKKDFANDPENLVAVSSTANRQKGNRGPDQWRPRKRYWCTYARKWINIKDKYNLRYNKKEEHALDEMLATCP